MTEIVSSPRNASTPYETLHVRSLVGILLRDLIGVRMLSEQGQISAIQESANAYLKRCANSAHYRSSRGGWAIAAAWERPPPVQMLQRDITSLVLPAAPSDINLRALGHAYGLASLVSIIPERPLHEIITTFDVFLLVLYGDPLRGHIHPETLQLLLKDRIICEARLITAQTDNSIKVATFTTSKAPVKGNLTIPGT
ncbi:hypothetical protein C0991_000629 [Blastosporella zonata]|nr:hypothetical protein C0991_000629 [Blastosporella zonata]